MIEAAGGELIDMYNTVADGPGVLVIFDVDPSKAPAISGVVAAGGSMQNIRLMRLLSQDEVIAVRQTAKQLKDSYTPAAH